MKWAMFFIAHKIRELFLRLPFLSIYFPPAAGAGGIGGLLFSIFFFGGLFSG
jgi:hypothetical protein